MPSINESGQGAGIALSQFILHLHPRKVPEETLRFGLSFGLGGISLTLLLLLVVTGVMQLLYYIPTVQHAHDSVWAMYTEGNLAGWLRNIHYCSSNLLVVSLGLHGLRVLCTDAFGGVRRLNWVVGTVLLLLMLMLCFTGYLLPWSQLSYWAVTIFINMAEYIPWVGQVLAEIFRAGSAAGEVGQGTLSAFFVLHTVWLPLLACGLLLLHFWLIRKAGGLVVGAKGERTRLVEVSPSLIVREALVGLVTIAAVCVWAAFVNAPVGEPALAGVSPNPVKTAWYFMAFQELLMHFHPVFAVFVFPFFLLVAFISLPYWQQRLATPGIWFGGVRGRKLALAGVFCGCAAATVLVVADAFLARGEGGLERQLMTPVMRGGVPLVLLVLILWALNVLLTRKWDYLQGEVIVAGWLAAASSMLTLATIGIWFRGPGMQLIFP